MEKQSGKLWGGRFSSELNSVMEQFNQSLSFDKRLFKADVEGSVAYAKALCDINLITDKEFNLIKCGLEEVKKEWEDGQFLVKSGDEDIHTANERRLKEKVGAEISGKLHTGRSRNDQIATDMRIWLKETCWEIFNLLLDFIEMLTFRSEKEIEIIIPGYTHLQKAQPVLWSHFLMSYAWMFQQDYERLVSAVERLNVCPLGSGAIAGNPFEIDREALAKELGFLKCSPNSMHAVADRDFISEFHFWASLTAVHFSKLAEDFLIYSTKEFGFVKIADAYSTGSSLMPQKKNADSLELIRGKSGRIIGNHTGLFVVLKGLPSTFNKDLQEDKEGMFDTVDSIRQIIQVASGAISTLEVSGDKIEKVLFKGLQISKDRAETLLSSDMLATDLAYYLVRRGVPFRKAHEIAGKVVVASENKKCDLTELPVEILKSISDKFSDDTKSIWNFENSVNQYTATGGTSKNSVLKQINEMKTWISTMKKL